MLQSLAMCPISSHQQHLPLNPPFHASPCLSFLFLCPCHFLCLSLSSRSSRCSHPLDNLLRLAPHGQSIWLWAGLATSRLHNWYLTPHLCERVVSVGVQPRMSCELWRCHLGCDGFLGRLVQHGNSCDFLVFPDPSSHLSVVLLGLKAVNVAPIWHSSSSTFLDRICVSHAMLRDRCRTFL